MTIIVFVAAGDGGQLTQANLSVFIADHFQLQQCGVVILGQRCAAEGEIAQGIENVAAAVLLNGLQHVGMVTVNHIGTGINGDLCHFLLGTVGAVNAFFAPVEGADDDLGTVLFELSDAAFNALFGDVTEGAGIQTDLQTAFGGVQGGLILFYIGDTHILQNLLGGCIACLAIVLGVVVCQGDGFHGGTGHNGGVCRGTAESEFLGGCTGGFVIQRTFQVNDGEVIIFKILAHIGKGIVIVFANSLNVVDRIVPVTFCAAHGAVAGEGQGVALFLRLRDGRFRDGRLRGRFSRRFGGGSRLGGQLGSRLGGNGFRCGRRCGSGRGIAAAGGKHKDKADLYCQHKRQHDQKYFLKCQIHRAPRYL